jgi:hypothetical protein
MACASYNMFLTNKYTPGGDGSRIYPYLKYMEKVPEVFPFWQAHKHHGYPLLADVENHMLLSLFLDTESDYFNLRLNFIFFFWAALFAFICMRLARVLGLSRTASFIVGATLIVCVPVAGMLMHGRASSFQVRIFAFLSILTMLYALKGQKINLPLFFLSSFLAAQSLVHTGYYFLINYYPAFIVFLVAWHIKEGETFFRALRATVKITLLVTPVIVLFSLPRLLPILEGVYLSGIFRADTPVINIETKGLYSYYLGLWPVFILSFFYSRGLYKDYAKLFFVLGSLNLILIFFRIVDFNIFFDLWNNTPILRNIRHQLSFQYLASIGAAFSLGVFIDSCSVEKVQNYLKRDFRLVVLISGLAALFYLQWHNGQPWFMLFITILIMVMAVSMKRPGVVISLVVLVLVVLAANMKESPHTGVFKKAENSHFFSEYKGEYAWWDFNGYDKFTPVYPDHPFSMVFLGEYRQLLSLLYGQEITAQRPHWVSRSDNVDMSLRKEAIARLMGIQKPGSEDYESPFRIYDQWVVTDDHGAVDLMKKDDFDPAGPIILAQQPGFSADMGVPLDASVKLVDKTAETMTLRVNTNKKSIILIPEIFHNDWTAHIAGHEVPMIKAYGAFRAVPVPTGNSMVRMVFEYKPFIYGIYGAFGSLVVLGCVLYLFRQKVEIFLWPHKYGLGVAARMGHKSTS